MDAPSGEHKPREVAGAGIVSALFRTKLLPSSCVFECVLDVAVLCVRVASLWCFEVTGWADWTRLVVVMEPDAVAVATEKGAEETVHGGAEIDVENAVTVLLAVDWDGKDADARLVILSLFEATTGLKALFSPFSRLERG